MKLVLSQTEILKAISEYLAAKGYVSECDKYMHGVFRVDETLTCEVTFLSAPSSTGQSK